MECRQCGTPLDKPGDYCLVCHTANCDAVVVEIGERRATLTFLDEDRADEDDPRDPVLGETVVTTTPETDEEREQTQVRNFAGRIADEIRRKRPDTVFVTGERDVIRALRVDLHHELYRVSGDDPVETVLDRWGGRDLEIVEKAAAEKIGGSHSTLVGDREGWRAIETVASHPHVKKIVPGPIDASGSSARGGVRAKVTRADANGNVRLLIREGSSIQENRVVTTAMDRETGERVREDLNDALEADGLKE
ncbi:DUF2103 domain-containing protein [Halospeciosus flavus]|uniref:DUF2103 domain-containing protein n=1 Tax=Halospeciosus flavus TaxID=3032283 RepID=A0ABD5Z6E8_9EURY|nr:DUF2103 domain-containing protein [Halospeciosus flavus]